MFANVAFFAACKLQRIPIISVPKLTKKATKAQIEGSGVTVARLFFAAVFGNGNAVKGLNFLIALSAFGNLMATGLGQSRMLRECGRQGVLPYPGIWSSTKPFGTPAFPYFVKWAMTILMILAIPTGSAFNFGRNSSFHPQHP